MFRPTPLRGICNKEKVCPGRPLPLGVSRSSHNPHLSHEILSGEKKPLCLLEDPLRWTEGLKKPRLYLWGVHYCLASSHCRERHALAASTLLTLQTKWMNTLAQLTPHYSLSQNVSRIDQATQRQTAVPGVWAEWSRQCHWQCAHGVAGEASSSQCQCTRGQCQRSTQQPRAEFSERPWEMTHLTMQKQPRYPGFGYRWGSDGHVNMLRRLPLRYLAPHHSTSARSGADGSWEKTVTKANQISMAAAASKPQTWGLAYSLGNLALDLGGTQQREGCDLRLLLSRIT